MHDTKAKMAGLCDEFLALEPYGDLLRAERDLKTDLEQPMLRLPEVGAVADLVAPGPGTAAFLADVDRLCFPQLLKALSAAAFGELEAHLRDLLPRARAFVHDDDRDDDDAPASRLRGPARRDARARRSPKTPWGGGPAAADRDDLASLEAGAPPDAEPSDVRLFVDEESWSTRCLLKCSRGVSIKTATRMGAKIDEYEKDKGPGFYPYCAFIGDSLRASVVCEDAEAFWKTYQALRGDPDDGSQRFRVLRLKNKLGVGEEPFNFHLNCSFQPSTFKAPIHLEIQLWAAAIMDLNDVSHWQYEVARADTVAHI